MRWETDEARAERVEDRGAFSRQCAALVMVSVRGMACVQDSCVRARGGAVGQSQACAGVGVGSPATRALLD